MDSPKEGSLGIVSSKLRMPGSELLTGGATPVLDALRSGAAERR